MLRKLNFGKIWGPNVGGGTKIKKYLDVTRYVLVRR